MLTTIIVSWNVRDLLRACLASLQADVARAGVESRVIVVDSASADGTPAMVRGEFPSVELIACDENVGYVRGNNLGLERMLADDGRRTTTTVDPSSVVRRPRSGS